VVVDVFGGLGNQMFQYAAGKALAKRLCCDLRINAAGLSADALREYSLGCFALPDPVEALAPESGNQNGNHGSQRNIHRGLRKVFRRLLAKNATDGLVSEPSFHYWDGIEGIASPGVRLHGYWQSPRYFAHFESQLRKLFTFADMSVRARQLADTIKSAPSVGIHVRRRDYLNPEVAAVHGSCSPDYYHKAYALIRGLCPECRVFVFSDDVPAAKQLFDAWPNAHFVEGHTQEEDMYLISSCSYHIIANSSFSWWGAWLAGDGSRQVVAPRAWFTPAHLRTKNTTDLFPPSWILV
jgi:hypothetical protein